MTEPLPPRLDIIDILREERDSLQAECETLRRLCTTRLEEAKTLRRERDLADAERDALQQAIEVWQREAGSAQAREDALRERLRDAQEVLRKSEPVLQLVRALGVGDGTGVSRTLLERYEQALGKLAGEYQEKDNELDEARDLIGRHCDFFDKLKADYREGEISMSAGPHISVISPWEDFVAECRTYLGEPTPPKGDE